MILESIFQNRNVPADMMGILTDFCQCSGHGDVSETHFSKCECPGGYNGDPHVFCQCSGHEEHA